MPFYWTTKNPLGLGLRVFCISSVLLEPMIGADGRI